MSARCLCVSAQICSGSWPFLALLLMPGCLAPPWGAPSLLPSAVGSALESLLTSALLQPPDSKASP